MSHSSQQKLTLVDDRVTIKSTAASYCCCAGTVAGMEIACPSTGMQKIIDINDEKCLQNLYECRMAQEIDGALLVEDFDRYIFRISGGFPMRQGVLTNTRVRLLCQKGHKAYRPRHNGQRKRKPFCGCIVGHNIAILNLVVPRVGEKTVKGLTNGLVPFV
jgi:small subunit ribosomal protein S6e